MKEFCINLLAYILDKCKYIKNIRSATPREVWEYINSIIQHKKKEKLIKIEFRQ